MTGELKIIAPMSDIADYQYGALFASPKVVAEMRRLVAHGESRLDARQAEVDEAAKAAEATTRQLAQEADRDALLLELLHLPRDVLLQQVHQRMAEGAPGAPRGEGIEQLHLAHARSMGHVPMHGTA